MYYVVLCLLLVMLWGLVSYTRSKTNHRDIMLALLQTCNPYHPMWADVKALTIIVWIGRILTVSVLLAIFRLSVTIVKQWWSLP